MDLFCNKLKCRVCLVENNSQLSLTAPLETANHENITYLECFQVCTRLEVDVDDYLPHTICHQCAVDLRDAYEFIKKAIQSHQTLMVKQESLLIEIGEERQETAGFEWVAVQKMDGDEKSATDTIGDSIGKTPACELSPIAVELTVNHDANNVIDNDSASLGKFNCSSIPLKKDESDHSFVPKENSARVKSFSKRQRKRCKTYGKSLDNVDCSPSRTSTEENDSDSSFVPEKESVRRKKRKRQEPKSVEPKSKSNDMKSLLCHVCPRTFTNAYSLSNHELTHTENRERNYTCEQCGKAFFTKRLCKRHSETHETNRPKPFKCLHCDKSFLSKRWLKTHMISHTGNTLECKICKKVLLTETSYRRHNKIHDINRKAFKCYHCEKSFFQKQTLDDHVQIHTNGLYKCDQCDKSFFYKRSLDSHQLIHTGETVSCEICGKIFPRNSDLKDHMRVHSKDTPFKCQYCDKAFSRKGVLNKHELEHEGFRYKCKICNQEFPSHTKYFYHKLIHIDITMKCSICGKGFKEKQKIRRHIAGVHKIEKEKTDELIQKLNNTKREYRGLIIEEKNSPN